MKTNYDANSKEYLRYHEGASFPLTSAKFGYDVVLNALGNISGKSILDFGCNNGHFSEVLAKLGASVTGVDIAEEALAIANSRKGELDLSYAPYASGMLSQLKGAPFDEAVSTFVFLTIPSKQELTKICEDIYKSLKPGGRLIILTNNPQNTRDCEFVSFKLKLPPVLTSGTSYTTVLKGTPTFEVTDFFWSHEDYKDIFSAAGFSLEAILEPIAQKDDSYEWLDERTHPPLVTFIARKS